MSLPVLEMRISSLIPLPPRQCADLVLNTRPGSSGSVRYQADHLCGVEIVFEGDGLAVGEPPGMYEPQSAAAPGNGGHPPCAEDDDPVTGLDELLRLKAHLGDVGRHVFDEGDHFVMAPLRTTEPE